MKITTWQLIKMLWRKDDWYQHYWHKASDLESAFHKSTPVYFYSNCGCIALHFRNDGLCPRGWSCEGNILKVMIWFFVIQFLAFRVVRFTRNHSYIPPEREEQESWK